MLHLRWLLPCPHHSCSQVGGGGGELPDFLRRFIILSCSFPREVRDVEVHPFTEWAGHGLTVGLGTFLGQQVSLQKTLHVPCPWSTEEAQPIQRYLPPLVENQTFSALCQVISERCASSNCWFKRELNFMHLLIKATKLTAMEKPMMVLSAPKYPHSSWQKHYEVNPAPT